MLLRKSIQVVGWFAVSGLIGCGATSSIGHKKGGSQTTAPTATPAKTGDAAEAATGPAVNIKLTANYKTRPVDVLIVRDGASHGQPMDDRVRASLPVLGARLWNLTAAVGSLHVAVLDHYFGPENQDPSKPQIKTAMPISDPVKADMVMMLETYSATEFNGYLGARLAVAGTRGGDARPAAVLKAAIDESKTPGAGSMGNLMRSDAFWSILYIGTELNPDDPFDTQDVADALKDHTSGYQISALTIDKAGCTFADTAKPQQANPKNLPQRNLEVKLQEMTHGIFGSVCADTYSLFMDDFVQKGTGSAYFPVDLSTPIQASSIKIFTEAGSPVKDFSYIPGTTQIQVSTLIPNGQAFTIQANADLTTAPTVSTDPGDPGVPTATK